MGASPSHAVPEPVPFVPIASRTVVVTHTAMLQSANITMTRGGVHATFQVFERAQRERRTRLLKQHLAQHVEAGVRGALIEAMERDLADLGIDGAQLLRSQ